MLDLDISFCAEIAAHLLVFVFVLCVGLQHALKFSTYRVPGIERYYTAVPTCTRHALAGIQKIWDFLTDFAFFVENLTRAVRYPVYHGNMIVLVWYNMQYKIILYKTIPSRTRTQQVRGGGRHYA